MGALLHMRHGKGELPTLGGGGGIDSKQMLVVFTERSTADPTATEADDTMFELHAATAGMRICVGETCNCQQDIC